MKLLPILFVATLSLSSSAGVVSAGICRNEILGIESWGLSETEKSRLEAYYLMLKTLDRDEVAKHVVTSEEIRGVATPPFLFGQDTTELIVPVFRDGKPLSCVLAGTVTHFVELDGRFIFFVPKNFSAQTLTLKQIQEIPMTEAERDFWLGTRCSILATFIAHDIASGLSVDPVRLRALREEIGEGADDEKLTLQELAPKLNAFSKGKFAEALANRLEIEASQREKFIADLLGTFGPRHPSEVSGQVEPSASRRSGPRSQRSSEK